MRHRGPDDSGSWWSDDGRVGLGHRRLSIIDISSSGHQPMQDASSTYSIVFNGEIYNYLDLKKELISKGHTFHSQSDTEVIIASFQEWGEQCLSRFNGMFAFALYDKKNQKIFLARDRAGEKPLFYSISNKELRFSSELKGLFANSNLSRSIDTDAFDLYLTLGYIPGEYCIIQGVKKIPPAHALIFDLINGKTKIWQYWELPEASLKSESIDEPVLLDELENLLEDAVCKQLQADVPVGVLLSGGLDSSLITAMAARSSNKIKTFTVGFPGFNSFDESHHARLVADFFNTEHIELTASKIKPDLLTNLVYQFDEPMSDSSIIPTYLVSQLVRQHCKVALGGDGGDELFGGYTHYNRLLWLQDRFKMIPVWIKNLISKVANETLPLGFKGRNWLNALGYDLSYDLPLIGTLFDKRGRKELMHRNNGLTWPLVAEDRIKSRVPLEDNLLQRATRMDFENYMADDILVKVDRASMLNSLELRSPLLDFRIIEFAYGKVPSDYKAISVERKILLKKLAKKLLPTNFDMKRKQGFSIPLATWLKAGPWRDLFHEVLLDKQTIFEKKAVKKLLQGQDFGYNNNERLFSLVLFELWRREYAVTL